MRSLDAFQALGASGTVSSWCIVPCVRPLVECIDNLVMTGVVNAMGHEMPVLFHPRLSS